MIEGERLLTDYGRLDGRELLQALAGELSGRMAVTSSFGAESAVLLALAAEVDPGLPVVFLDTGELFDETLEYRYQLERRLGLTNVVTVRPTDEERSQAEELWRSDPDLCCELRKVRPLARAVQGYTALVDGRKRAHGFERGDVPALQLVGGTLKVSPLAHWSGAQIEAAFVARRLPRHPLLEQGYRSIGCWPCTRPTAPGESPRAGRWAGMDKSECGIHTLVLGTDGAGI